VEIKMHLFEQIYRTNRIYWHGSDNDFDKFKTSKKGIFLSTSKDFAIQYTNKQNFENVDACRIYMCKLARPLNLFNIASKKDRKDMNEYFRNIDKTVDVNALYEEMKKGESPMRGWSIMEKYYFREAYYDLGYDGFTVSEQHPTEGSFKKYEDYIENISVFNPDDIIILEKYFYDRGEGILRSLKHGNNKISLGDKYISPLRLQRKQNELIRANIQNQ
jgi:hypothetical protein